MIKVKKVLHVITDYSGIGGAEMMLHKLILAQPSYEHYIVSLIGISEIYKDSLCKVVDYKALDWSVINTFTVISRLKSIINKIQPDIIQSWMYHANFMSAIANKLTNNNIPLYWGVHHCLNSIDEESWSTKIAIYLNKLCSNMPAGIIYCAETSLNQHKKFGFKNFNQVFIPNGVDLNKFKFNERAFNFPVTVGFVGRYHKAKGIQYLFEVISAFRDRSDVTFMIAGQGLSLDNYEIQELYKKHRIGNNLKLLGSINKMENFYHGVDVLLMTSITEGFPNVLIEAMATGVACISTDVGDAKIIIEDTNCIVEVGDVNGLIFALEQYINKDNFIKNQMSIRCSSRVKYNYDLIFVANRYIEFWESKI